MSIRKLFIFANSLLNFLLRYALPCGRRKTKTDWNFEHRAVCEATCEKYRLHCALLLASTHLSEWTYLPKVTLATRYLVSVPAHFPSNVEITHPSCLAFTDALKAETYLLQINLSFCFGWRDQSADFVVFGAQGERLRGLDLSWLEKAK